MSQISKPNPIPPAGSFPRPWLWQVWAALGILFIMALVVTVAFRPPLSISPPGLSTLGDTYTVSFSATNNTDQPTSRSLLVIVGHGGPTMQSSDRSYVDLGKNIVSLTLAPKETRNASCQFTFATAPRPNNARIELVTTSKPNP